jgi:apolipoprotein N-acyltransferase
VSAIVDPVGRVVRHTGTFRQEAVHAPVHWLEGRTVYNRIGDLPWWLATVAVGVMSFRRRRNAE